MSSNKTTEISNWDLAILLSQSFRYCLGRHTYAVSDCCELIKKHHKIMPMSYLKQIESDLEKDYFRGAMKNEHACDIESWLDLLRFIKGIDETKV